MVKLAIRVTLDVMNSLRSFISRTELLFLLHLKLYIFYILNIIRGAQVYIKYKINNNIKLKFTVVF